MSSKLECLLLYAACATSHYRWLVMGGIGLQPVKLGHSLMGNPRLTHLATYALAVRCANVDKVRFTAY